MSIREDLYQAAAWGSDRANALIDAFKEEVLREAAERQRSAAHIAKLIDMSPEDAVRASADLIDPQSPPLAT